jgi:hypothetical protein
MQSAHLGKWVPAYQPHSGGSIGNCESYCRRFEAMRNKQRRKQMLDLLTDTLAQELR